MLFSLCYYIFFILFLMAFNLKCEIKPELAEWRSNWWKNKKIQKEGRMILTMRQDFQFLTDTITMLRNEAPSDLNSVKDDKVSPSITVRRIPPGCTSLSLHRLECDSSWSEALEGNGSFSQMLIFAAVGHENNIYDF